MEINSRYTPSYIFEASWEVCNKVGGIYTVLSTRAHSLQKLYNDRVFFIGPDIWNDSESTWFEEDHNLYTSWREYAYQSQQLEVRIGRWNAPGKPIVFLVKYHQFQKIQNEIFSSMWSDYGVDSLLAYGDYYESTQFAYATGVLIESFYRFHQLESDNVVAHFNEWMLGAGALYIKKHVPKIATLFTTHATSIGRSIAGNNLPLYDHLNEYNGDQMARQLNMVAKHSIEKAAARNVDCFTTVSEITARECQQFLERQPEVVTPNGFEKNFIPKGKAYKHQQQKARKLLLTIAEKTVGYALQQDTVLIGISGRYEYKNKGIDVFIEAMQQLSAKPELTKDVIAFIMVPGWIRGPRKDLQELLTKKAPKLTDETIAGSPFLTHDLVEPQHDMVMQKLQQLGFNNSKDKRVKIIFAPSYLNGDDGIFNLPYYDLLIGFDLTVFPSYYEPWGYTPHESVAFAIPTITTSLSGFGSWINTADHKGLEDGVEVIYRNDHNQAAVAEQIASTIQKFTTMCEEQIIQLKEAATRLSDRADWSHFISFYQDAYRKALHNSFIRLSKQHKLKAD
jgi:glycosyltransferase involved in cell wall biosynthesis